jgi:hypothetical protein
MRRRKEVFFPFLSALKKSKCSYSTFTWESGRDEEERRGVKVLMDMSQHKSYGV